MRTFSVARGAWLLITGLLLAGCNASPPAAPAENATTPEETAPATTPPPAPAAAATAVAQPMPAAAAANAGPSVRDHVRQYLESDGQGGWRKNEKAATELEKTIAADPAPVRALLQDSDSQVRHSAAVLLLPQFDASDREQVKAFTALLDDPDRLVRARAIDAARQFRRDDQLASLKKLATLLDAEREDRAENRAAVARLCGSLKRAAETEAPALANAARYDPDAKVRAAALAAAVSVATTPPVLQALRQCLTDKEPAVRLVAASRLRQLGVSATTLAPELAKALGDADSGVAENAAEALIAIGTAAVGPLSEQLATGSATAKKMALATLATLGPVARPAIPAITQCQQDPDGQVRQLADAALKRVAAAKP